MQNRRMTTSMRNWAGNITYAAREVLRPTTIDGLQQAVRSRERVKVLGTRHSFNGIADSEHTLLVLDRLPVEMQLDPLTATVRASGGSTFGELAAWLHARGRALPNLASLPHISLAGTYATGTHGSGSANPVLAASVVALELVMADGERIEVSRASHPEVFDGVVVGLGALGVVTSVTLATVPAFDVRQDVYLDLPFDAALAHFDALMDGAYSVSLFTGWQRAAFDTVWCKRRLDDAGSAGHPGAAVDSAVPDPREPLFGAAAATENQHPIPGLNGQVCSEQLSRPGPAHERLPHFRMAFQPSHGNELQSEYLLPRHHAVAAFNALRPLQAELAPLVMVNEVRTVAADGLWLSPAQGRDSVAFHFTWRSDVPAVQSLLVKLEAALAPFEPRPHWGKLFAMAPAELRARHPRLQDFAALARRFDPNGRFRNRFLDTWVMS
jgi:xylitol oxidase